MSWRVDDASVLACMCMRGSNSLAAAICQNIFGPLSLPKFYSEFCIVKPCVQYCVCGTFAIFNLGTRKGKQLPISCANVSKKALFKRLWHFAHYRRGNARKNSTGFLYVILYMQEIFQTAKLCDQPALCYTVNNVREVVQCVSVCHLLRVTYTHCMYSSAA